MKLNELKNKAQERIASLKEAFETQDNSAAEMDLTRTAYPIELGTRHPLSIVKNEIIDIFHRLGFSIADGPGNRRRLARIHCHEFCRRPSCT